MKITPRPLMSIGNTEVDSWKAHGHSLTWLSSECYCVSTIDIHRGLGGIDNIMYFSTLEEAMSEFKLREAAFIKQEQELQRNMIESQRKWQEAQQNGSGHAHTQTTIQGRSQIRDSRQQ